jgi:glycosyltransferase involved in cell wall biosynthesis
VSEVEDAAIDGDRFPVVASLGAMTGAKRIPQLLRAFARLRRSFSDAMLVLAGAGEDTIQLGPRLERLGLRSGRDVLVLGHVAESRFCALLARADICVSLRWPTLGETSASVIRALALGRCVVVSEVGWYAELPDPLAVKVRPDEREVDTLAAALELLAGDERLRHSMGSAARRYIASEHHIDRVADAYLAALRAAAEATENRSVGRNAAA